LAAERQAGQSEKEGIHEENDRAANEAATRESHRNLPLHRRSQPSLNDRDLSQAGAKASPPSSNTLSHACVDVTCSIVLPGLNQIESQGDRRRFCVDGLVLG
jgi:hypothetical protein